MKAYLITPDTQSIEEVEIASLDDIKALIGYDTLASDAVGTNGDRLFFDEECFLRGTPGRFQVGTLVPVSGKGVIAATSDGADAFQDVVIGIDDLRGRTRYL